MSKNPLDAMRESLVLLKDYHFDAGMLDSLGDFEVDCINQANKLLDEAVVLMENLSVDVQMDKK